MNRQRCQKFLTPTTKLREGNVFTRLYLYVHWGQLAELGKGLCDHYP